ncbi:MAG: hypothetical protein L6Q83_03435 [Gammaproteobacteria bacterium]|nr:hypothetical protein [Gammaproteobacteria bacterium]
MFDLVADVESYPEFLPGCTGAQVHARGGDTVEASIALSQGPLKTEFRTANHEQRPRRITMALRVREPGRRCSARPAIRGALQPARRCLREARQAETRVEPAGGLQAVSPNGTSLRIAATLSFSKNRMSQRFSSRPVLPRRR